MGLAHALLFLTFGSTSAQFDKAYVVESVRSAASSSMGDVWSLLDLLAESIETGMITIDANTGRPDVVEVRKLLNAALHVSLSRDDALWLSYYDDIPGTGFGFALVNVSGAPNQYTSFSYPSFETCASFGLSGGCMVDHFVDQRTGENVPGAMLFGSQVVFGAEPCANDTQYNSSSERYSDLGYGYGYGYGNVPGCVVLPADVQTWVGAPYEEPYEAWSAYGYDSRETSHWWQNEAYRYCYILDGQYQPCYLLDAYRAVSLPGLGICALFELAWDIKLIQRILVDQITESSALVFILDGTTPSQVVVASGNLTTWDRSSGERFSIEQVESDAMHKAWEFMAHADRTDADDGISHITDDVWVRWIWLRDGRGIEWRIVVVQDIICPVGHGVDRRDAIGTCVACAAGKFADEPMHDCESCPSGTVAPITGSEACLPCNEGFFQTGGATRCERCIEPFTSIQSATSCDRCLDGWYSPESFNSAGGNMTCRLCPQHATCVDQSILVDAGFFRTSQASFVLYACPFGERACPGGANASKCITGYNGPACGACAWPGYFHSRVGDRCQKCEKSTRTFLCVTIIFVAVSAVAAFIVMERLIKRHKAAIQLYRASRTARLKIMIVCLQIIASVQESLQITFPSPFRGLLKLFSFLTFDFSLLPVACLTRYRYFESLLLSTLLPMALIGLLVITGLVRVHLSHKNGVDKVRASHIKGCLWIMFAFYPTTSSTIFDVLRPCQKFDEIGDFLYVDVSVKCGTAEHRSYVVYSIFMLVLITFGVPLLFASVLMTHRHLIAPPAKDDAMKYRLRASDTRLSSVTFLFSDYRPSFIYAEPIELIRRVFLVGGVKLLGGDGLQAALSALFALICVFYFDYTRPYSDKLTNLLG